jgi:hypothetical protein
MHNDPMLLQQRRDRSDLFAASDVCADARADAETDTDARTDAGTDARTDTGADSRADAKPVLGKGMSVSQHAVDRVFEYQSQLWQREQRIRHLQFNE